MTDKIAHTAALHAQDEVDRVIWPLSDPEFGEVVYGFGEPGLPKIPMAVLGNAETIYEHMAKYPRAIYWLGPRGAY